MPDERAADENHASAKKEDTIHPSKVWYAGCKSGHKLWTGPDRKTYKEARKDAKDHDKANHGGKATAGVLTK